MRVEGPSWSRACHALACEAGAALVEEGRDSSVVGGRARGGQGAVRLAGRVRVAGPQTMGFGWVRHRPAFPEISRGESAHSVFCRARCFDAPGRATVVAAAPPLRHRCCTACEKEQRQTGSSARRMHAPRDARVRARANPVHYSAGRALPHAPHTEVRLGARRRGEDHNRP